MNDDLERRLEAWGAEAAPQPDPAFSVRLEADLRSQAYFGSASPTPDPSPWRQLLRPAALVFSSVVLLIAAFAFFGGSDTDDVIMSAASNTEVTLPNDTVVSGSAGLALPNGSQISVNSGGSAVVDGVVLGGGTLAEILDGKLEIFVTLPTSVPVPPAAANPDYDRHDRANTTTRPHPAAAPRARP